MVFVAKKHEVICPYCSETFNTTPLAEGVDFVHIGTRYWHMECRKKYERKQELIAQGDYNVEGRPEDWRQMTIDYLEKGLKIAVDYPKFNSQWSNLLKKNRTAKGIFFTVKFMYEALHLTPEKSQGGIGLVGTLYEDSKNYWQTKLAEDEKILEKIEAQARRVLLASQNSAKKEASISYRKNSKKPRYSHEITLEELERMASMVEEE